MMKLLVVALMIMPFFNCSVAEVTKTIETHKSKTKLDKFHHHQTDPHHIEEMIKAEIAHQLQPYVFEKNEFKMWQNIKIFVNRYLTDQWREGNLWGADTKEAFDIQIGLGTTMTEQDIKDGILRLTVKVAINSYKEYTILNFTQETMKQ